jgi:LDH2 family malate/lactate/ureidoglycolate dehydrogenase
MGHLHGPYEPAQPSGCGHLMLALNIAAFMPEAEFGQRMESLIAELKSTPLSAGCDEIFYPGELEARAAERQARDGLPLPAQTVADLQLLAQELGVNEWCA